MLILHILIALCSVVLGTGLVIRPSFTGLKINYGLIAATLASGTYLVIHMHSNLVQSCLSGLTYTAVVTSQVVGARYRLIKAR